MRLLQQSQVFSMHACAWIDLQCVEGPPIGLSVYPPRSPSAEQGVCTLGAQERMAEMVGHLAGLAEQRLILSFAPSTPYFLLLKRIGEFFPKGAKVMTPALPLRFVGCQRPPCCVRWLPSEQPVRSQRGRPSGHDKEWRALVGRAPASKHAAGACSHVGVWAQATRAYLHTEEAVEAALAKVGWRVTKREMTSGRFYFSRLLQAAPAR